ncbi:hypothetical protein P5673_012954 [Acropora cervicornis]|uniref:Uncharacterized protein n=1 Tax=Acropora cervicornis TaxID=6130 RepID=A0AAD9QMB0_ACRCE|nr:hypothetical protein P5673_012954 [Acropora cervicornis]
MTIDKYSVCTLRRLKQEISNHAELSLAPTAAGNIIGEDEYGDGAVACPLMTVTLNPVSSHRFHRQLTAMLCSSSSGAIYKSSQINYADLLPKIFRAINATVAVPTMAAATPQPMATASAEMDSDP